MNLVVAVAVGSALGGVARYYLTAALQGPLSAFPWGTLVVNAVGCFILGGAARYTATAPELSPAIRTFIIAGFCGGFTTFSTFSYETIVLIERGAITRAFSYVGVSVLLGLLAATTGAYLVRSMR